MELSNAEKRVLKYLKMKGSCRVDELDVGLSPMEVMHAASWLRSKGLLEIHEEICRSYSLGEEGLDFLRRGLPEKRLLEKTESPMSVDELKTRSGMDKKEFSIAFGWMRRKGWVDVSEGVVMLTEAGERALSEMGADERLLELISGEIYEKDIPNEYKDVLKDLLRRGNAVRVQERVIRTLVPTERAIEIGDDELDESEEIAQITPEMLQTGLWRSVKLRRYDINAFVPSTYGGKAHPLHEIIARVKEIFIEMGFEEIRGQFVETAFWNMDVLFIPQDHPAREMQDTLYLKHPEKKKIDPSLMAVIRGVHETGGETGSAGWRYRWDPSRAESCLLRTHTTVNTIRYLADHPDPPVKVFSVGKVFRRESIDATHLPEFYQIEGIVMEDGANFRMLIGVLKEFYKRMGFDRVRIRPGYFPYTEPSLEVEVNHKGMWMELGGAGVFRPEVTLPIGVKNPVLAWGLGLERLAMMILDLNDIRTLYMSDIDWLRRTPTRRGPSPAGEV